MEYALRLPAKTFFSMLQKASEIRTNREMRSYIYQVHIAAVSRNTGKYAEELISHFENRMIIDGYEKDKPSIGALNTDDPLAIGLMCGMFDVYRRSIGGH